MKLRRLYRTLGVSKPEADALEWALHLERVFDGAACSTGRNLRLATMRALESRGLVTKDWCTMVDGDGYTIEPERYRRCFRLTAAGRELARRVAEAQSAALWADAGDAGGEGGE
jgi:hypothetical protein